MNYEEALEWLAGKRSMCNSFGSDDESHARLAEADAGCTQQAYWIIKSYKEGLIQNKIAVKPMSNAEESAWREE